MAAREITPVRGVEPEPVPGCVEAAPAGAQGSTWRILSALIQLGAMQGAVAIGTLIRNKAMAVYLKPEGYGLFTQLMAVAAPLWAVVQCGMVVGLSRNTAAARSAQERQRQLAAANCLTGLVALISLGALIPLVLSPGSDRLLASLGVPAGAGPKLLLMVLLLLAPLEALRNNYLSFLQGLLDIKGISTKRSLAILASTIVALPLIAWGGLAGACAQTAFASLLLAVLLGLRCKTFGVAPLAAGWHLPTVKLLAAFGSASLLIGFTHSSVDAVIRARLIAAAGIAENGLYQAALSLSAQVTAVVLGSVGAYSLATLSQTADADSLSERIDELLRVVVPVATIGLGAVGILGQPLFQLLFSSQFAPGVRYMPLLLAANFVQVGSWAVGATLLGSGLIRFWIGIQMINAAIRYVAAVWLTGSIGAYAIAVGFLLGMFFDLTAYAFVSRRRIGVRIARRAMWSFFAGGAAASFAAVAGSFPVHWPLYVSACGALCLVTAWMAARDAQPLLRGLLYRFRMG